MALTNANVFNSAAQPQPYIWTAFVPDEIDSQTESVGDRSHEFPNSRPCHDRREGQAGRLAPATLIQLPNNVSPNMTFSAARQPTPSRPSATRSVTETG